MEQGKSNPLKKYGYWDVDHGKISIGGTDIRDYTLESLMNQMSMVFQSVYLFQDTIENNIRFGKLGASREEVIFDEATANVDLENEDRLQKAIDGRY